MSMLGCPHVCRPTQDFTDQNHPGGPACRGFSLPWPGWAPSLPCDLQPMRGRGRCTIGSTAQPAPAARMANALRREDSTCISFPADAAAGAVDAMEREMRAAPTATLLAKIRKLAKQAARDGHSTHGEELDRHAQAHGYPSWRELQATLTNHDLPVDPPLRELFDQTPNEERSQHELDLWWDRPYAVTRSDGKFEVRCLDGGAWDRSTCYGVADTFDDAKSLAQRKLIAWQRISSTPVAWYIGDGLAQAVVMPRRPGEAPKPASDAMPMEELGVWLERWSTEVSNAGP